MSTTITRVNGSVLTNPADFYLRGTSHRSSLEFEAEIARTRADLGDTAAALPAKTDVKARLRARAAVVAGRTTALAGTVRDQAATAVRRPVPVAVLTATVTAATVAAVLIRRTRR